MHTCKSCSAQERLWPWNSYLSVKHCQTKRYSPHMEAHLQKIPSNGEGKGQPNYVFRLMVFPSCMICIKVFQPVHSEGGQPWVFFGRNDTKAETPVLWPPHAKSWLIGKDSDAGRDWGQEEKGTTEDEMAGWHHHHDWTWVWVNSRSWWWTGRPGVLQFMRLQRVGHDWATELNWTEFTWIQGYTRMHW